MPSGSPSGSRNPVPRAPLVTRDWPLVAIKKMLRDAVEKNIPYIGWTTGQQQIERYRLSQKVESIEYFSGEKEIEIPWVRMKIFDKNGSEVQAKVVQHAPFTHITEAGWLEIEKHRLHTVTGVDLANRILANDSGVIEGLDVDLGLSDLYIIYIASTSCIFY